MWLTKHLLPSGNAGIEYPAGWLSTVARNKAIDRIRRNREVLGASNSIENELLDLESEGDTPEKSFEHAQTGKMLRTEIEKLSADHREVLWLSYFEEKSINEIADEINIRINTAKTRLFHARKLLASQIKKSGIEL